QVHGVDATGNVIVRRKLKRRYVLPFFQKLPPCLIGIEACASSHHWSRELGALGHTVRLMPAAYVKPYVKRQKNDAADAEAICEAVTRANMRFVATKTLGQQSCLMLHRTRHLFIRQQTAVINAIRAHLAEFGIVAPVGRNGVEHLLNIGADCSDKRLPDVARACVAALGAQLRMLKARIREFDRLIMAWHRSNEASKRLDEIPGVGPALATALVASVADPRAFRSGRDFSAWIGLVPKQHSSGGKDSARGGALHHPHPDGVGLGKNHLRHCCRMAPGNLLIADIGRLKTERPVSFHGLLMCMREFAARRAKMDAILRKNHMADAAARAAPKSQWHAQREIHEERTGTVQRINIELWIALDQFAIRETSRIDHRFRSTCCATAHHEKYTEKRILAVKVTRNSIESR